MAKLDTVVAFVMFLHLSLCPYTKVEESFNFQAIHDIIYHGTDLDKYDHHEFPGVVPRTFIGPLVVSAISYPIIYILKLLEYGKIYAPFLVRCVLGMIVCHCFRTYKDAVGRTYGRGTTQWLTLVTISQFHFMFYCSRSLPNVFALALLLLSVAWWLRRKHGRFIWAGACCIIVFRSEVALLLGPLLLVELIQRRLSLLTLLLNAVPAALFWLGQSIVIDSWFWRRWLWPEGEVLWYNTILNKSSDWGTEPYLWYLYSALPRGLGTTLVLLPISWWVDRRSIKISAYALLYVLVYSFLPHKELRFIIYVFPMFNTTAALGCHRLWRNRKRSVWRGLLAVGVLGHLLANLVLTGTLIYISHNNYPGGHAMYNLHHIESPDTYVNVHIDVATAQTGVSRFSQLHQHWRYDKTEDLEPDSKEMMSYTHLFIGATSPQSPDILQYTDTHTVSDIVTAFSHVSFHMDKLPPIKIHMEPKIFLLKKQQDS